jgi:hypothetical protein
MMRRAKLQVLRQNWLRMRKESFTKFWHMFGTNLIKIVIKQFAKRKLSYSLKNTWENTVQPQKNSMPNTTALIKTEMDK